MNNLYEQMNFILSGGALRSLVEFLTPKVSAALIVSPKDADLEIVDAVGAMPDGLFLKGWAQRLASVFPERPQGKKFEVSSAPVSPASTDCEWSWAVALRGKQWAFYILLRETPEGMLEELSPIAGLIALWQDFQYIEATEARLSRMAYMILATKSTLASIFEPMPLEYYASFLTDVLNESIFPSTLSIFKDDGAALSLVEGEDEPPERAGIYTQKMLPPTPIVTKNDSSHHEVVLPIIDSNRLFCVMKWDKNPEKETLDFLELIGNLASRAMAISTLRTESTREKNEVSSGKYTILTLSEALNALKTRKNRLDLLAMSVDIFTEVTQFDECLLVVWNNEFHGYAPIDYRKGSIKVPCESTALPSDKAQSKAETQVFDLTMPEFSRLLNCPWPEMAAMKLAFPIWDRGFMDGFIAVSSDYSALRDGDKLSSLIIVAQFTSSILRNFV